MYPTNKEDKLHLPYASWLHQAKLGVSEKRINYRSGRLCLPRVHTKGLWLRSFLILLATRYSPRADVTIIEPATYCAIPFFDSLIRSRPHHENYRRRPWYPHRFHMGLISSPVEYASFGTLVFVTASGATSPLPLNKSKGRLSSVLEVLGSPHRRRSHALSLNLMPGY